MTTTSGAERPDLRGLDTDGVNIGDGERVLSVLGGAGFMLYGLVRRGFGGLALAALGGAFVYRGLSGFCGLYQALGIDRGTTTLAGATRGQRGIKIERDVTIAAPPDQLYRLWRDFANLPRLMSHLERVQVLDDRRSRWTVKAGPVTKIEWEAEIINDRPGEMIAWQTVGDAAVSHAGSVHFDPTMDERSTSVRVSLQYDPPGGEIGHALAALFGQDAGSQIERDLRELKRAVEAGEMGARRAQYGT